MSSNEKFCLKWNDFKDNLGSTFGSLREDTEFSDVTLASEDGQQLEAHKVVLTVSSPFFKRLLQRSKHYHPIIYMRGIKLGDLEAIMDFLYNGEANIYQEDLEGFLKIAEELQLRGITGGYVFGGNCEEQPTPSNQMNQQIELSKKDNNSFYEPIKIETSNGIFPGEISVQTVAIPNQLVDGGLTELDEQVKSMMVVGQKKLQGGSTRICTVCEKEGSQRLIIDHIERNHISGVSIPCNICQKTFRSRASLKVHNFTQHK